MTNVPKRGYRMSEAARIQREIAAHSRWAKSDRIEGTRPAREGFHARFLREVDPDNKLSEAERRRRAWNAKQAYMKRLALKSAKARRERKAARKSL